MSRQSDCGGIAACLGTVLAIFLNFSGTDAGQKKADGTITVIAGGESHGMIEACDCELEPGGGIAKRASLLAAQRVKSTTILLLDAGGFSAGGIYDDYTEGRRNDSLRTLNMLRAMGAMKYDAAVIGDDDLQYGGAWLMDRSREDSLPLVSANCYAGDRRLADPYIIVVKNGLKIAVTGVTTPEKLFAADPAVTVRDPVTSLRDVWQELSEKSDLQVILSHLGQERTAALAKAFPDADLVVNGHRKTDKQPAFAVGKIPVMQFSFQGKSLNGLTISKNGSMIEYGTAHWIDVVPELPDNPEITGLLKRHTTPAAAENSYDLYIMSMCPYGMEALGSFLAFTHDVPSIKWKIWFIGSVNGDSSFSSLHGKDEAVDEMRWLAVRELYPKLWIAFLNKRVVDDGPTTELFSGLGIDILKINAWVIKNGKKALKIHYDRSTRLSINASPTLLVNNRPFGRTVMEGNLKRFHCASTGNRLKICASLPQCDEDADCRAPGKLGTCTGGKCVFRDAVPFIFTVVAAESTCTRPENKVITTTRDLFPGADVRMFSMQSEKGRNLLKKYQVTKLPFYLFGREVTLTHNYSSIQNGLVDLGGAFTFEDNIVPVNYFLERKSNPGTNVLYVDPFFQGLPDILTVFSADSLLHAKARIEPVIYSAPRSVKRGTEEWFRHEEALRWLALGTISPRVKMAYLEAYGRNPGSSYWTICLAATGVSADSLQRQTGRRADVLDSLWKVCTSLSIREPAVLLLGNREVAVLSGERELRRILLQHLR